MRNYAIIYQPPHVAYSVIVDSGLTRVEMLHRLMIVRGMARLEGEALEAWNGGRCDLVGGLFHVASI